uniref:RING-type E3 ubiquitin transferase n=1 Tax=Hydatigena taeniaeformis TaxID=6205 RepID=A0A0R3X095_HYDTA
LSNFSCVVYVVGIKCDACEANAFRLRRYKCLRCVDFDLCGPCYDRRAEALSHRKNHPMQCLILESDRKIFFPNSKSNEMARSYICPICGAPGFKAVDLGAHVHAKHSNSRMGVLCPICIYPPLGNSAGGRSSNPNRIHNSFSTHLSDVHRLKALTSGTPTTTTPDILSPAVIETFLTRDPNYFYEPAETEQRVCNHGSFGRSLLSAEEQELFDLIATSSMVPDGQGLRFRTPHNSSPSVSGQVSHSEQVASSKVIEKQADSSRPEAGDEASESGPQLALLNRNINSNNNGGEENNGNAESQEHAVSSATVVGSITVEEVQSDSVAAPVEPVSSLVSYGDTAAILDPRVFEAAKKKCDPVWLSFVHELIWDSLHIAGLSLTPSEGEKE